MLENIILNKVIEYIADEYNIDVNPIAQRRIVDIEKDWNKSLKDFKKDWISDEPYLQIGNKKIYLTNLEKYGNIDSEGDHPE